MSVNNIAEEIVRILLGDKLRVPICEASVHRPARGRVWVGAYTGPEGGQIWRSTGLTDYDQALLVAKKWEREARAERARLGLSPRQPLIRVGRSGPFTKGGQLSQKEVALLLNISERAVKAIERRAIQKLRRHPAMRELWRQFLAGELSEQQPVLASNEIEALFSLARTAEERLLMQKVLRLTHLRR